MKIRAIFLMLAGLSIVTASAFASDYCVKDISLDTYKSFIPQPRAQRYSNEPLKKDLPSFSVSATLDRDQLSFVKQDGQSYPVTKLNSGDDYNGWDAIYELEDHWLYIAGAQYNHVLHFYLNPRQQWVVDQIIRTQQEEGIVERLANFAFGWDTVQIRRDNLTSIKRISGNIVYSPALQRLFIPTTMQEFKGGDFTPFGNVKAKTYVGDIPRLKIAFLKADDGQLYSYDGVQLKPVINGRVKPFLLRRDVFEQGLLHDAPTLNRSFYAIRAGVYELVKKLDTYELKPIPLPADTGEDLFFTHFIPTPDGKDIAILTRGNIILLSSLEGIYPRSIPNQQINITGSDELPALIPSLKGILFSTGGAYVSGDETEYYHLLKKCSDK